MATVRETIEIVVSGGQKVEALKNQLLAAANAAAALADQVGEIDSRLKGADQQVATFGRNSAALSRTARVISGELGRERDYQARRRSAQDRIRALRQSGQFSQARSATERLEGRDQQRVRLRESARLLNAELAERKRILAELLQVRGIVKREKARAVAQQRLAVKLVQTDQAILERQQASLRQSRRELATGARATVLDSREKSTDVLFRRRSAAATRIVNAGEESGLSKAKKAEVARISSEIDQVRERYRSLNEGLKALRDTAAQAGEEPAKIRQQTRDFAAARRQAAVELGRLVEDLREVNRTARGSRRNFDVTRRLGERADELLRVGAIGPKARQEISTRLSRSGDAITKGNIEEARDIAEAVNVTVSAKERQLKRDKQIQRETSRQFQLNKLASDSAVARERQRQSALTQESKALNSIRVQQQQIADLASKSGATASPSFQRASGAVARLPQLLQSGDFNEFNRVLGDATAFSRIVRSELGIQARGAQEASATQKRIRKYQTDIGKIEQKLLSGKQLQLEEGNRLLAYNRSIGAGGLPALPPAAPGSPAMSGRARPLRTQSVISGAAQPAVREILGGARTTEEAEATKRLADSFAVKAGKKAGPKFAQEFISAAADKFNAGQLLSAFGAAFNVFSDKSISKITRGTTAGGPRQLDAQAAQQRLARDLFAGQNLVGKLQNLERKRVAGFGAADPRTVEISQQVVRLETELNAAKQTGFELTKQNLDALTATINKSRQLLELDAQQNKLTSETAKIRRLQGERRLPQLQRDSLTSILGDLGRAEMSSKVFRGGRSGEQALSNIIGAFNASVGGKTAGTGAGGAAASAGSAGQNVVDTFSSKLAAGAGRAAAAGTEFASAAVRAVNRALGISSPSKVAKDQANNYIGTWISTIVSGAGKLRSTLASVFSAATSAASDAVKTGREAIAVSLLNIPSKNPQAGIAGQFDFGAKRPSLGANYGTLSQAIADLTIDPAKYRRRIEAVGLQNFPTELLREASGRGTLQDVFPDMKLERIFRNLPGLLEKQIEAAFVKSASLSSTRFVAQSLAPAVGQPRDQLLSNPGILMSQGGRFRAKQPSISVGASAPLFFAPSGSFLSGVSSRRSQFGQFSMGSGGGGLPPVPPIQPPAERPEDRINAARGDADRLLGLKDLANLSAASANQLELLSQALSETRNGLKMTDKGFDQLTKVLNKVDDQIARRDPNADFLTRRFGQRGGQAVGEGLIGGAFPLLFGQGVGAAALGGLGGALGGFAGGTLGFGLSLAGTAIGSQVDLLMQATQDTGNMLRDLVGNFEQIKESGLLASRSQEKLIGNLLEAGNKTAAYAIIQDELNRKLGVDGAAKLREAADAGDRLKRAMADLGVQIQLLVAGPLTDILNAIASGLERSGTEKRFENAFAAATPEARAAANRQLQAAAEKAGAPRGSGLLERLIGRPLGGGGAGSILGIPTKDLAEITAGLVRSTPAPQLKPQEQRDKAIRDAETRRDAVQRELEAFNKRNEGVDILKGFKQQANAIRREQEDINRQSFELRRDYERQIEDIRRGVEDKISQLRQENAQKELEILIKQGQIREQQFKNAATTLQGALAGDPLAQSLADAVTTYLGAQLSAQNEIEQRRKQFEIEINNQQVELEKYKLDVARTISRLNTDTVEKVAQINLGIARRNEDAALNVFATEKKTAELRLRGTKSDLEALRTQEESSLAGLRSQLLADTFNPALLQVIKNYEARITEINKGLQEQQKILNEVSALQAPPKLQSIAPAATKGVSLAGVNAQKARGDQLRAQFQAFSDELTGLVETGNFAEFTNRISEIGRGGFDELSNNLDTARKELALVGGDFGPIAQGITDAYQKVIDDLPRLTAKLTPELQAQVPALKKYLEVAKQSQIQLERLRPTLEFYITGYGDLKSQTEQAKNGISELLSPTKNYDRLLEQINKRGGLGINEEETRRLLQAARNLDELNARLKVLNGLNDIAGGWTDSFIQLNKELLKGGNLLESVQRFAEGVADRTLDVVLEFTLRPIQEQLFKNLSKVLGIEAPQDPTLLPIKETAQNTKDLVDLQKRQFAGQAGIKPPEAANNIVAAPSATSTAAAQRIGVPEYIDKSVLRNYLISQGMGRTSGDFTNAGHRTPNHMLNAMDMGFIAPQYDSNYVQKTKEMEAKLRATGAFGNQLFGPISDPIGHKNHLHVPTPGGKVKVTPGLAELLNLGRVVPFTAPAPEPAPIPGPQSNAALGDQFMAMLAGNKFSNLASAGRLFADRPGGPRAYPLPAGYPYLPGQGPAATQQVTPPTAPIVEATKPIVELGVQAKTAADGVKDLGTEMSDSVTKFQRTVGTSLQAISSIAMGIGGAQMIRKGGAYNTLMGAASIFGSISSITGMFGTGGALSGLFGRKPKSSLPGFTGEMLNLGGLGLPGYASGGRPDPYDPAIIGENGPELWVPDRPGTIIPNDELYVPGLDDKGGSAPSIGRYARRAASSMESGDGESGDTIYTGNYGRAVPYQRSETTREIDRLERITTNPKELPPIKYETTRVNEYDFVTPEQLEASNARTAKIARNQTIRELADSMKTRKRLGL